MLINYGASCISAARHYQFISKTNNWPGLATFDTTWNLRPSFVGRALTVAISSAGEVITLPRSSRPAGDVSQLAYPTTAQFDSASACFRLFLRISFRTLCLLSPVTFLRFLSSFFFWFVFFLLSFFFQFFPSFTNSFLPPFCLFIHFSPSSLCLCFFCLSFFSAPLAPPSLSLPTLSTFTLLNH